MRNSNNVRRWVQALKYILASALLLSAAVFMLLYGARLYAEYSAGTERHEVRESIGVQEETEEAEEMAQTGTDGYWDISLRLDSGSEVEEIKLYVADDDACFFLPACSLSCSFSLLYDEDAYELLIDDNLMQSGARLSSQVMECTHTLIILRKTGASDAETLQTEREGSGEELFAGSLRYMLSENLPAVFIETYNGTMEWINQSKENEEPGTMCILTAEGETDSEGAVSSIHARGNSSFTGAEKKSYKVTLEEAGDLLGMGEGTNWVLAANAFDVTKLRNGLAYELARELGLRYAMDTRYVDVWCNGEYAGNYLLCESVEVDTNRVDIGAAAGSYLFVTDHVEEGDVTFVDPISYRTYIIRYPQESTQEDADAFLSRIEQIEELIADCDTEEKYETLKEYIDMDSFAIMYLMNLLTNEVDTNVLSVWYYLDGSDGKLYMGPAWDYDRAWGNDDRSAYIELNSYGQGFPEWLADIPYFMEDVKSKLEENRELLETFTDRTDTLADEIRTSVRMDSLVNHDLTSSPAEGFAADLSYLKNYMERRLALTLDVIENPEDYYRIYIESRQTGKIYWLRVGDTIPEAVLQYLADTFKCTGFQVNNGNYVETGYPVMSDLVLYPYYDEAAVETVQNAAVIDTETEEDMAFSETEQNVQTADASTQTAALYTAGKETGMILLSILIMVTPGIITMGILSDFRCREESNRQTLCRLWMEYLISEFLIFMFAYGVIYILKGSVTLSLSAAVADSEYTLYQSNTVFLFMLLELVGACGLGIGVRKYREKRGKDTD